MNIIDKLRDIVRGESAPRIRFSEVRPSDLEILRSKKNILQQLEICKEQGKLVGIFSRTLGEGLFVTGIEDIYKWEKEEIIVLKPYDIGGNILPRNYLSLSEIKAVCPFNCTYKNPFLNLDQVAEK